MEASAWVCLLLAIAALVYRSFSKYLATELKAKSRFVLITWSCTKKSLVVLRGPWVILGPDSHKLVQMMGT